MCRLTKYQSINLFTMRMRHYVSENMHRQKGVHLTLLPHIFSVEIKSGAYYIAGQWGQVQNKIK